MKYTGVQLLEKQHLNLIQSIHMSRVAPNEIKRFCEASDINHHHDLMTPMLFPSPWDLTFGYLHVRSHIFSLWDSYLRSLTDFHTRTDYLGRTQEKNSFLTPTSQL